MLKQLTRLIVLNPVLNPQLLFQVDACKDYSWVRIIQVSLYSHYEKAVKKPGLL